MPKPTTAFTGASVDDYIAERGNEQQRADAQSLIALFRRITGHPPRMWGPSIVGFGSYQYKYPSGHSGEAPVAGFAIRGRELVIYISAQREEQQSLLAKLGKHKMGKSCLYFRTLADLDTSVLQELVSNSVASVQTQ